MRSDIAAILVITLAGACLRPAYTQEHNAAELKLELSAGVRTLLQAEMRELSAASQAAVIAYVSGDWESLQRLGEQMRASYVMQQNLSASQKHELAERLPAGFKRLDAEFHDRAGRLAAAAAARDPELVAFHLHRLLETCASCHAEHAAARFPGLALEAAGVHGH